MTATPALTKVQLQHLFDIAADQGIDAAHEAACAMHETTREAEIEAIDALEHDDSEWADIRNGYSRYGEGESYSRNEAGEWLGLM